MQKGIYFIAIEVVDEESVQNHKETMRFARKEKT